MQTEGNSCSCNYQKAVCLEPGVNAYEMTGTSAGKVCLGKAPFSFSTLLQPGQLGTGKPTSGDPSVAYFQTYQPARLKLLFIKRIRETAGGTVIPRARWEDLGVGINGFWYQGDNWMPQVPEDTDQSLQTGIGIESLDCETYVRCWGNPLPTSCLPTFSNNQDKAAMTFGFEDILGVGEIQIDWQATFWHGITPLSIGRCYMENPVQAINPSQGSGMAMGANGMNQQG